MKTAVEALFRETGILCARGSRILELSSQHQVAEEMTSVFVEENGETSVAAVEDTPEKKVGTFNDC